MQSKTDTRDFYPGVEYAGVWITALAGSVCHYLASQFSGANHNGSIPLFIAILAFYSADHYADLNRLSGYLVWRRLYAFNLIVAATGMVLSLYYTAPRNALFNFWPVVLLSGIYLLVYRRTGRFYLWSRAWLIAMAVAAAFAASAFSDSGVASGSLGILLHAFAVCWLNVLASAWFDRGKDGMQGTPNLFRSGNFHAWQGLLALLPVLGVAVYDFTGPRHPSLAHGMIVYTLAVLSLFLFEKRVSPVLLRLLPDAMLPLLFLQG